MAARASQIVLEAAAGGAASARASQLVLEVIAKLSRARASGLVLEVLVPRSFTRNLPYHFRPMPQIYPELPGLAFSVIKRPTFNTSVKDAPSLREVRIGNALTPRWEFDLTYDFLPDRPSVPQVRGLKTLMGCFIAMSGALTGMLLRDPDDCAVTAQPIATTDGASTDYTIVRTFGDAEFNGTEPVGQVDLTAPFVLYVDGVLKLADDATWGYTVQQGAPGANVIRFNSTPGADHAITADFSFFYYVRFKDDSADFEKFMHRLWRLGKVTLRGLRAEGSDA